MTHGKGKKGGRGAGLRGGRGNAGLLKHKWMHMVKYDPNHFGRHGFKRPQNILKDIKTINLSIGIIHPVYVKKVECGPMYKITYVRDSW